MRERVWWALLVVELLLGGGALVARYEAAPAAEPPPAEPAANGLVVLLSDYGDEGAYVGCLKGAVLSANPEAVVVDATHAIPKFDVESAAWELAQLAPAFPSGTTFVIVVDPRAGAPLLAVETLPDGRRYVAPDNGLLTDVVAAAERVRVHRIENETLRGAGPADAVTVGMTWLGPVGARLAGGLPVSVVGPATRQLVALPRPPVRVVDGVVEGRVVHVDSFGNLLTDVPEVTLQTIAAEGDELEITMAGGASLRARWVREYGEVESGSWLVRSTNQSRSVEIAISYGNAAAATGVRPGTVVRIRRAGPVGEGP